MLEVEQAGKQANGQLGPTRAAHARTHELLRGAPPVMALNALPQPVLALELRRQRLLDLPPRQTLGQHGHADQSSNRFGSEKSPAIAFKIPQESGYIGNEFEGNS